MAAWPGTLPRPVVDGYALQPEDPAVRTDMEVGAMRVRRRTAARNDRVQLTWLFTQAQMDAFRAWYDNSAENAGGASWFTVDLAIGTSTGVVSVEAQFVEMWKAIALPGLKWRVTAKVQVR